VRGWVWGGMAVVEREREREGERERWSGGRGGEREQSY
jgi:hypothetical protein